MGRNFIVAEMRLRDVPLMLGVIASMGPQLYRRGNGALALGLVPGNRCFNGAATLSLRKLCIVFASKSTTYLLQWGRNFIVAEILQIASLGCSIMHSFNGAAILSLRKWNLLRRARGVTLEASMGPQLYRCGNGSAHFLVGLLIGASMGPQLYRCGNLSIGIVVYQLITLQWGRNFIVAEIMTC